MTVPEESDYQGTDEVVCPYCGKEQGDSWELSSDDGDLDCYHCGRRFMYTRTVSVDYSTHPIIGPHKLDAHEQSQDAEENPLETHD